MQHFHLTVVGCVETLCWFAAMTAIFKSVLSNKGLSGQSQRLRAKRIRRNQIYFQYFALSWVGMSICKLLPPRDDFDMKFYGVMCFVFLSFAALSVYISTKVWRRPKWMRPDPDSRLHLGD